MDISCEVIIDCKTTELKKVHEFMSGEFSVMSPIWSITGIRIVNIRADNNF